MFHLPIPGTHVAQLFICVAFMSGIGAFEVWRGASAGERKTVDAAELEAGNRPPGTWLRIEGRALWDRAAVFVKEGSPTVYVVPVVSRDWQKSQPVRVVMECRREPGEPLPGGESEVTGFNGTVVRGRGIARAARQSIETAGVHIADDYIVFNQGASPRDVMREGFMFLGIGAICLALVRVVRWVERRERIRGAM